MLYSTNKVIPYYLFYYVIKHIFCYILFLQYVSVIVKQKTIQRKINTKIR